jgi:hypothetical protein
MPIEVIYADRPSQAVSAKAERDNLWLSAAELAKVSGWELKSEGVCKGDVCVPIPIGRDAEWTSNARRRARPDTCYARSRPSIQPPQFRASDPTPPARSRAGGFTLAI